MTDSPRVLVLSRDLTHDGGVVQVVASLLASFTACDATHFPIGRRPSEPGRTAWTTPLRDPIRLAARLRREPVDVVHLNPSFVPTALIRDGLLSATARRAGAPQLAFFHGWDAKFAGRALRSPFWRAFFSRTFRRAECIAVLAPDFADTLASFGVPRDRIVLLPTLFDGRLFAGVSRRPHETVEVLFLSRLIAEKGAIPLVLAIAELRKSYPEVRLTLAGDGPERGAAEALAARCGIPVRFPGYVRGAAKAQLLLDADVFALPTTYGEGLPVCLLEAMAAGVPLLTTHAGGIAQVVAHGREGYVLGAVTAGDVARGLEWLLSDARRREAIGHHNRKVAWERYEAAVLAARVEGLYRDLTGHLPSGVLPK